MQNFCNMKRPLAISLSPNLEGQDVWLAFRLLVSPWTWVKGDSIRLLELWFRQYFGVSHAVAFASGRGALFSILKALEITKGDQVLLQAFTCVAVPNAVLATGATPVYVDIDKTFTMNPQSAQEKISQKTKAIIVQHTFGIPTNMEKIKKLAKEHNLFIIEDCAHGIGGEYKGKKLGLFGHAAFISFGRDKAFSSVSGGMAITDKKLLGTAIRRLQKQEGYPHMFWIFQQLLHSVAFFFILPLYDFFSLGKILLVALQKLHFLSFPVLSSEKQGEMPRFFIAKLPNVLASLALLQLRRLEVFNKKRVVNTQVYTKVLGERPELSNAILLRFPLLIEQRDNLVQYLRQKGVYTGKWYSEVIDPKGVDYKKIGYVRGSCPVVEHVARKIINLPTYPTMQADDARKVAALVKNYLSFPT